MSTSVNSLTSNFFPEAENGFTTTTAGSVSSGATTVTLNSVSGYTNGEPVVLVIDPTDTSKKQTFTGIVDTSGVQVTSVVWTAGTNQTHALGATVVDYATATHISMISKGIRQQHNQDGTHGAVTATSVVSAGGVTGTSVITDAIAEKTAAAGVTIDSFAIKDGSPKNWDGWITPDETWTYASASTFIVPGDQTAKYTKGTRLKFTQTTVKYGTVASSSHSTGTTTVTIIVNTDFVLANAAISANYYSYAANPQGYPAFFNYTATTSGYSGGTVNVSRFSVIGARVTVEYCYTLAGAGVSGGILIGVPVAIDSTNHSAESSLGSGHFLDTGTQIYQAICIVNSSTTVAPRPITASGTYGTYATATSSTVPFTWGNTDLFAITINYQMA